MIMIYFLNIVLIWKIVRVSEISVIYILVAKPCDARNSHTKILNFQSFCLKL